MLPLPKLQRLLLSLIGCCLTLSVVILYSRGPKPKEHVLDFHASNSDKNTPEEHHNSQALMATSAVTTQFLIWDRVWPHLREELCPNMKPNIQLGDRLFDLARKEIRIDTIEGGGDRDRSTTRFFNWAPGGFAFHHPSGNETTVYARLYKCGNSQIRHASEELFKRTIPMGRYEDVWGFEKLLQQLDEQNRLDQACIVTAIRDPVSHFISAYNEYQYRLFVESAGRRCRLDTEFVDSLWHTKFNNDSKQRFEQIVAEFLMGPVEAGLTRRTPTNDPNVISHLYSMSSILLPLAKRGVKLKSYLPSIVNVTETWPRFVQESCNGIPEEFLSGMMYQEKNPSSDDEAGFRKAAEAVWRDGGSTASALCIIHAIDYSCWKNLPQGVPQICKIAFLTERRFKRPFWDADLSLF